MIARLLCVMFRLIQPVKGLVNQYAQLRVRKTPRFGP